jgi:hypothetical protein
MGLGNQASDEGKAIDTMIRKIQLLGLALFAVFAFSAVLAGMASAEVTLLAEWLRNGAAITANLASVTTGEITLEDNKVPIAGKVAVLCSGILDGTVGANGADEITKALNLSGEELGAALTGLELVCSNVTKCEAGTTIQVWAEKLPWKTLLFLMENGEILDLVEGSAYEVQCLVLGITASDLCEAADTEFKVVNNASGAAEVPSGETALPLATCTQGGAESGVNTTDVGAPITLVEGGTLSVSSE